MKIKSLIALLALVCVSYSFANDIQRVSMLSARDIPESSRPR